MPLPQPARMQPTFKRHHPRIAKDAGTCGGWRCLWCANPKEGPEQGKENAVQTFPISLRSLAALVVSIVFAVWLASGLLGVVAFAALVETCLRVLEWNEQRLPVQRDKNHDR